MENFWNTVGTGIGGSAAGAIGSQIGYGLGQLTGYNDSLDKRQREQQQALTGMQYAANWNLMKAGYEQQLDMWNKTNYGAQIAHLKSAGLNPALMYAKGGAGGTTGSGSASVGGGQAANSAAMQQANSQQAAVGMGLMKMQSEIELNKATANKLNTEAERSKQETPYSVEELKQRGKNTWLRNLQEAYRNDNTEIMVIKNKLYGEGGVIHGGLYDQELVSQITKANAEAGNSDAQKLLTNTKAMGYWQELANATKNADSQAIQAAAQKLSAEFNYGEYTNWKYWAQLGSNVFKIIK